jgi:predicted ATP-grasp superfamily ATP-dependent carboligase
MQRSETTWIIAPETDGILYELTRMALEAGCQVIGCTPEAIKLAERKSNTLVQLSAHQIPCIPAMHDFDAAATSTTGWVIKPDDGVGGEGCCFFTDAGAALSYTQTQIKDVVIQRYVPGISASMSLLCYGGQARLLAGNRQLFRFIDGKGVLEGVIVNGLPEYGGQLEVLALAIARAIPGLQGYVGVDVIISDAGPVVVEINPRLTTSYAGLRQALGANPAELILSAFNNCTMPEFEFSNPMPVTIKI